MSKSTKIIAALGVVAGLGVAALPAFTYAESTTGDVDVLVQVDEAIAMTITGNNDDMSEYGEYTYTAVSEPTGNPTAQGWYVSDGDGGYELTSDIEVQSGTTYYTRSGGYRSVDSFSPIGAAEKSIDGHTTPATSITGVSSSFLSMLPNTVDNTDSVVTVYTNSTTGYKLSVRANTNANMVQQGVLENADTINAVVGTPSVTGQSPIYGWAFKVAASGNGTHAGAVRYDDGAEPAFDYREDSQMTTTDQDIVESSTKTSGGDEWTVTYDVATRPDQSTGVYKVNLTYTAATTNS